MKSLQRVLDEQLSVVPKSIAIAIVTEKLKDTEHKDDSQLIEKIVDRLMSKKNKEEICVDYSGSRNEERRPVIKFTDADVQRVDEIFKKFEVSLPGVINSIAETAATQMLRRYERDWAKCRNETTAYMDRFRQNLHARWGKGFDSLRMLIELSRDVGSDFRGRRNRAKSRRNVNLRDALCSLHARAVQIASEIMVLMENGFADGAMARWRTLHEIVCVATVLVDGGEAIAERYLAHEIVEAKKGIRQYQECCDLLGYKSVPKNIAAIIERKYSDAISRFGKGFGEDYGWAASHLNNPRPNFSHIEHSAGLSMMRSHYKMASHNVHAGAKGIAYRLGSLDGHRVFAGASNVGFVEPGQNLALSLFHINTLLFPKAWTVDRIAQLLVFNKLLERIPRLLVKSQKAIERDEKKLRISR